MNEWIKWLLFGDTNRSLMFLSAILTDLLMINMAF